MQGEIIVIATADGMVQIAVLSTEDDEFSFDIDVEAAKNLGESLLKACLVIEARHAGKN